MPKYAKVIVEKNALLSVQESISIGKQILQRKLAAYLIKISKFEKQNDMDTVTFRKRFNKGELGDKKEWLKWDHYASAVNLLEKKLSDLEGVRYES
ncbi:MAG: hypothetical protein GXO74_13025 [Calditrichaeota bacterium]|nr:hypothetical protein [Calditrichota bacterium]